MKSDNNNPHPVSPTTNDINPLPDEHPLTVFFPLADSRELKELAQEIANSGQQEPRVLYAGRASDDLNPKGGQ